MSEMYKEADALMAPFKSDPSIKYKLVCLWVSISTNYIVALFPNLSRMLGGMIAGVLDAELETRKEMKNGLSLTKEGHSSGSSNNPPS